MSSAGEMTSASARPFFSAGAHQSAVCILWVPTAGEFAYSSSRHGNAAPERRTCLELDGIGRNRVIAAPDVNPVRIKRLHESFNDGRRPPGGASGQQRRL